VKLKVNVILVDDMIDTGGTLAKAADLMMEKALSVFVLTPSYQETPTKEILNY
jgi:phosphoribosylpyrophosphate synthetase